MNGKCDVLVAQVSNVEENVSFNGHWQQQASDWEFLTSDKFSSSSSTELID